MKICNKCNIEKSNKSFGVNNRFFDNLHRTCKECDSARRKKSYSPEKARIAWKKNKYSKPEHAEDRRLRDAYGITKSFRDYMAQKVGERCEICDNKIKLVVDHDHETGIVRGMLCSTCNRGLGHFDDNIDLLTKALTYIIIKTEQNNTEFAG